MSTSYGYTIPSPKRSSYKEFHYIPERDVDGSLSQCFTITLSTSWTSQSSGFPYYQTITCGVWESNNPIIDVVVTSSNYAKELSEWNKIIKAVTSRSIENGLGQITFYATAPTTVALTLKVMVI